MQEVDRSKEVPLQSAWQANWNPALLWKQWLQWWKSCSLLQKLLPLALVMVFLTAHLTLGGFRPDHLVVIFLALAYYGGPRTQSLYLFFLPFILFLVIYDSQAYFVDLIRAEVRVAEPYQFDMKFFGIETSEGRLLPSQWLQNHTHPVLDVITSLAYLAFVFICLGIAIYFRFFLGARKNSHLGTEQRQVKSHALMWGMFWLNILNCSTYFWYPAAPPWYVDQYGLGPAQLDILPSAAGALRFDAIFGINLMADIYANCPNPFGAIPSGHVAFPALVMYFSFKFRSLRIFSILYFLLICFSVIYLNHHYVLDVLWGAAYGLFIAWAMDKFYRFKPAT
jgi:inositol phosphorylceramide synthase catalytic subunit